MKLWRIVHPNAKELFQKNMEVGLRFAAHQHILQFLRAVKKYAGVLRQWVTDKNDPSALVVT